MNAEILFIFIYELSIFYLQAEEEFRDTGKGFGLLGAGTGSVKINMNNNQKVKLCKNKKIANSCYCCNFYSDYDIVFLCS